MGVAISLFSGAGGLDLGVERAGFAVTAAIEANISAADTMDLNFKNLRSGVIRSDILCVDSREILRAAGLRGRQRPALLIGGPPCTPFSKSGFWLESKRSGLDPAACYLQEYTRVLAETRPRAFILENVHALTFDNRQSRPAFDRLLREIDDAGYIVRFDVLNAADFGVPQRRNRLFVIGVPKGYKLPDLPRPTHSGRCEGTTATETLIEHRTAGEVLQYLDDDPEHGEALRGRWSQLLPLVPPGDNYLFFTARRGHPTPVFEWRSRYWSFLLKLDPNRPSPTIQAQPGPNVGPFHWENRRLRVAELKRLFSFPDDFRFTGTRSAIQSQIGNSVPPLLAERVAKAVAEAL